MRKHLSTLAALLFFLSGILIPSLGLAAPKESSVPKQVIKVPFVELTEPIKATEGGTDYLYIPWMAEYMTGIYRAGVAFASFLAAVFIVIGGLRWAVAGGNSAGVTSGKKMIKNGLIGLLLSLGAYTILHLINPELVKFESMKIRVVKSEALELETLDKGVFEQLAAIGLKSNPQLAGLVCDPLEKREADESACYHGRPGTEPEVRMDPPEITGDGKSEKDNLLPYLYAAGKAWDIDPCIAYAVITEESGWVPGVVGHDEDFDKNPWTIPSRMRRLAQKDCGITLSIPREDCKNDPTRSECVAFDNAQKGKCMNKESHPFKNEPPDYGFDWAFSHGIGLGQSTIFQNSKCPDGKRGITYEDRRGSGYGSRCYTVPELLNPTTAIDAMYREIAGIKYANGSANRSVEKVLTLYICSSCESQAQGRINIYHSCRANFQGFMCGIACNNGGCKSGASRPVCDNFEQMMADWSPTPDETE
jgi:hypothetical protein